MRIFKKDETRTVFTVAVRDQHGKEFRASGFTDHDDTKNLGDNIAALVRAVKLGFPPPLELAPWIKAMPANLRARLIDRGLLPAAIRPAAKTTDILARWEAHLRTRGGAEHAKRQRRRVQAVLDAGGASLAQLTPEKVNTLLAAWVGRYGGEAGKGTALNHIVALKSCTAWATGAGALTSDPLAKLQRPRVTDRDKLISRDVLSLAQQRQLIEATHVAPTRWTMTGDARAVVYAVTLATGFRRDEIFRAIVADFAPGKKGKRPTLRVVGKNGREDLQPLPPAISKTLAGICEGRAPGEKLFACPSPSNMSRMIAEDYATAKIKAGPGRKLDFHALRHTFCTMIGDSGVPIATAQKLMRHQDVEMTMIYMHARSRDTDAALDAMPDLLGARGARRVEKTG